MDETELASCLNEVFTTINEEARLAGDATLEKCLERIFGGPGANWLLNTAQSFDLADAGVVRQSVGAFREVLRTEGGRKELKVELRRRRGEIEEWRRRLVSHMRTCQSGKTPLGFECQGLVDAKEVYGMIMRSPRKQGESDNEDSLHRNQGQ